VLPTGTTTGWAIERKRFRQLRAHALERLCERLAAAHGFGEAVEAGLAASTIEPLRESAHPRSSACTSPRGTATKSSGSTNASAACCTTSSGWRRPSSSRELVASSPEGIAAAVLEWVDAFVASAAEVTER